MASFNCFNGTTTATITTTNLTSTNLSSDGNPARHDHGDGDEHDALIKVVFMDILTPVVCGLGLVGNLLSLVVLTTEKMHRTLTKMEISAHIGLIALAVSDFLFCLLVLVFTQVDHPNYFHPDDLMIYFNLLCDGIITIFIIFSTWLIVVMAAERYIAVCHPLRARKVISLRRTRAVIVIVFVVCVLATIPIFLERSIEEVTCDDGRKLLEIQWRSQQSQKLRRILWAIFFDFIPCIALIYFNMCLIIQISKAKKLRGGLAPTHYTFQASRKASRGGISASNNRSMCKHHINANGDHAMSSALIKSNPKANNLPQQQQQQPYNKNDLFDAGTDSSGGSPGSKAVGNGITRKAKNSKTRGDGQERYTRLSIGAGVGGRTPNYPSHNHSSDDSAYHTTTATTNPPPAKKLTIGKRMITTNGTGSVVRKRPSDSALNSVTATLVAVVLLFLILVSPSELLKFSLSYTSSGHRKTVTSVTNFMQVLNFSLNFVLYCAVNKTFRQTLRGLACCCWLSLTG